METIRTDPLALEHLHIVIRHPGMFQPQRRGDALLESREEAVAPFSESSGVVWLAIRSFSGRHPDLQGEVVAKPWLAFCRHGQCRLGNDETP
jgi:hypothetical protein